MMEQAVGADRPPLPDDPDNWASRIQWLDNALIMPPLAGGKIRPCGIFNGDNAFCHEAVYWKGHPTMVPPPSPERAAVGQTLKGRYLWGGNIHYHFGHFLLESLGRLWGCGAAGKKLDGVLFFRWRGNAAKENGAAVAWDSDEAPLLKEFQREVFRQFGVDVPVGIVSQNIRVEALCVPGQGFGAGKMASGTAAFRDYVTSRFGKDVPAEGPERLYISRSLFGARRGGVIGEPRIEARLREDDYEIFHPEKADLRTQIARYKAAREVVALDGSALHLLAMVARPDQKVALIRRRRSAVGRAITDQLRAFSGRKPHVIDAIKQQWIREDRLRVDAFSVAELSLPTVGKLLFKLGMASRGGWEDMPDTDRDAILSQYREETGQGFRAERAATKPARSLPDGIVAACHGIEVPESFAVSPKWLVRKINNGRYEKEEIAGALELVGSADRVLECGAGIGIVGTTVAHNRRPQKILSFEANPNMIPVVEATYRHNRVDDIISVTHGALMSEEEPPETVDFNISKRFAFSSLATPEREISETVSVPVHRFDAVKEDFKPTALLMDIEGGELPFLEAADLSGINSVVIEFHPEVYGQEGMMRCKELLRTAGFEPLPRKSTETVWAAQRAT
ncbi:FkbM family methyltransferase [Marimonas sp. MJW-29]|uniref:FkbM family methyltransferase n=1 Tax=Sulfitobacter sediminis TaxID=3234186 RepID=A0ABV3RMK1_9RHOB